MIRAAIIFIILGTLFGSTKSRDNVTDNLAVFFGAKQRRDIDE